MGYSEWDELTQAVYFIVHPYTDESKRERWTQKLLPLLHSLAMSDLKASKSIIKAIENSIEELNPEYYETVIVPSRSETDTPTEEEEEIEEDSDSDYETESEEDSEDFDEEDFDEDTIPKDYYVTGLNQKFLVVPKGSDKIGAIVRE